ncbi:bile acid:sodium symporter [Corynebacterium sp. ES2794-CONJ1]|uniref:bile acid:sodium symporter family protein n=1 Tax=unclassified Corynebacterium TaxID=2624378 RepID=UPI002168956A|nr:MULTISPECIES: bile acid:sodium symporter family protein [unclassified Corynebacterium]MCS4492252.1 bile acid:sodium symporter [Corynebacterium sp. ES2715-CONJ3]MCU9519771.1 bile acid:sodium symporter [Corynebacterium sp. ES2794-CONJ1]
MPKIDPLIVLILLAVLGAVVFPISGTAAEYFSAATALAIALLFFLYGARLSTAEALEGLKHWRLHLVIVVFTFVFFPLIGLALKPVEAIIGSQLYIGLLYLTLVPSTVQSSVAFTSIAKGNVAGAIVSASLSNLLGVVLTPVLVMLTMTTTTTLRIDASVFFNIALQLLLPFILGQLSRPLVAEVAKNKATKVVDRLSIAMVVYSAFSAGMVTGLWASISYRDIILLIVISIAIVSLTLALTYKVGQSLGFTLSDTRAIQFCGSKKSLATGLPMAAIIFGAANIGVLITPLMIFHQIQLMMCSWLAARYGAQLEPDHNVN